MSPAPSPAMVALLNVMSTPFLWGQVAIHSADNGWELRHERDAHSPAEGLRLIAIAELRQIATCTSEGAFRPLKAAPTLQPGWRALVRDAADLELALSHLYPGSVPDWFVAQSEPPPVTHYREFTNRQTGMYRITQMLNDQQAGAMVRAGCPARFCLKRRLWSVEGLAPDRADEKSLIPCLEPCAVLLEFARKTMRIEQEERKSVELAQSECATVGAALKALLNNPALLAREGETNSPLNPRRVQLLLEKHPSLSDAPQSQQPEE